MSEEESKVAICISRYGSNNFYVTVVGKQDKYGNNLHIKSNGKIDRWNGAEDYMNSYQECLDAISLNYTIIEETDPPDGLTGLIANKDSGV